MATIVVCQRSGDPYGATDVAKAIFDYLSIDSNVESYEDYPVERLESGLNYSYEVWLRFRCDVAPITLCNNFKIWATGSLNTGIDITINTTIVDVYDTPTDEESIKGTRDSILNHNAGNKINISGDLVNIGDYSSFMVWQLEVNDTADLSGTENLVIYYSYDEF